MNFSKEFIKKFVNKSIKKFSANKIVVVVAQYFKPQKKYNIIIKILQNPAKTHQKYRKKFILETFPREAQKRG